MKEQVGQVLRWFRIAPTPPNKIGVPTNVGGMLPGLEAISAEDLKSWIEKQRTPEPPTNKDNLILRFLPH